nr:LysR family transcriptional regulator [Pseudomonas oryzae]
MNLNHLRHLVALAEHQSFRKAADALCLTQPALSRSLQALEQELGVRLIDRLGKRNILTAHGRQVVDHARRMLFEAAELQRGIRQLESGQLGDLSLGLGPTPAAILMTPFLRHMATAHPRVRVKVARGAVNRLLQSLREEAVDIIVIDHRALAVSDDLQVELLPPLRGGFVCRAGHPLREPAQADLQALRAYPVASMPLSDEIARNLVTELGTDAHPERLMTISCEDVSSVLEVVEATDAVFFGIFASARAHLADGRLHELRVQPHVERTGQYALVSLAGRSESPALTLFRRFVHAYFKECAEDPAGGD